MFARRLAKGALGLAGAAGVSVCAASYYDTKQVLEGLKRSLRANGEKETLELQGADAMLFPWHDSAEEWELRRVKLTGLFLKDRYFVRKERQGKPGFLVFKPFVTGYVADFDSVLPDEEVRMGRPRGLLVSIGWIPAEQVRNFEEPALGRPRLVEPDALHSSGGTLTDPATELVYQVVEEGSEPSGELPCPVTVEGYLRRGEREHWATGKWQDERRKQRNFVDLRGMLRHVFFDNLADAEKYYLDLHWEREEEGETPALSGPSRAQDVLAAAEDMERGSRVYQTKKYLASLSALLLASSLLI